MAKGDADKVQNSVDYRGGTAQNTLDNQIKYNTGQTGNFQSLYGPAATTNVNNYNDVQASYDNFLKGMPNQASLYGSFLGPQYQGATQTGPAVQKEQVVAASDHPVDQLLAKYGQKDTGAGSGVTDASYWKEKYDSTKDPYYLTRLEDDLKGSGMDKFNPSTGQSSSSSSTSFGPGIGEALAGYSDFAKNGGFSPEDINAIRARSVAPIRSMADRNQQEIERQSAIRGAGNSPNTAAAIAKVGRDANYAAGDVTTNAEAMIAQLMQQGKLYGLGGLASTGLSNQSNTTQNRGLDLNAIESSGNQQLGALGGKTSLYGTTPGLTNMFGNQLLASSGQGLQASGLQNQLAQMIINGQLGKAQVPGDFQSAMGNIGSVGNLIGSVAGSIAGIPKIGGGANSDIFQ
jgi:hypothetical protein